MLPALRDALGKADDPRFKKMLMQVIERLEVRSAARQLAAKWGDRCLRYKGKKLGWMHLKAEERDGAIVDAFFYREAEGLEQTILHTITSRADEGPPRSTSMAGGPACIGGRCGDRGELCPDYPRRSTPFPSDHHLS